MSNIKKFRIKNFKVKKLIVELQNLSFSYEKRPILDNINIQLNAGEIVGLLGPNGAGKSTIFNLIIGLVKPKFGKIIIQNKIANEYPVSFRSREFGIGYVPQHGGYFNDLSTIDNLKAIGEILIKNKEKRELKINELITKFEIDNIAEIKAKFLSGGQKRKLVICLALLGEPKILLCDEIFAALDVLTIQTLKKILVNLQNENPNICIVVCEHQARELLSIVDRALILSNGNIVAEGSPSNLIRDEKAKSHYFGDFFSI